MLPKVVISEEYLVGIHKAITKDEPSYTAIFSRILAAQEFYVLTGNTEKFDTDYFNSLAFLSGVFFSKLPQCFLSEV